VVPIVFPGAPFLRAVDDPRRRQRGLTRSGAGLHSDPLISSRSQALVSWGPDWVVLGLIIVHPFWAPTQVVAWPIAARLSLHRPGLTQGKGGQGKSSRAQTEAPLDRPHRPRPEWARELIRRAAQGFPDAAIIRLGDSGSGGRSGRAHRPPNGQLLSRVHPKAALDPAAPPKTKETRGRPRKTGARLPGRAQGAQDTSPAGTRREFDPVGWPAAWDVKTIQALDDQSGRDRLRTLGGVRACEGQRPDQMVSCTPRAGTTREVLSASAGRGASACPWGSGQQSLGWEDPAHRLPRAVAPTAPRAMSSSRIGVVWCHQRGHHFVRFPVRPGYPQQEAPSFADVLTTLRRLSSAAETAERVPQPTRRQTWLAPLIALRSRTGGAAVRPRIPE
jgi:hypothetical protein